jgi:hypothetical protein
MSRAPDDREGLSPPLPTAAQLAELWEDDEDDDGLEYEPASENSENTWGTEDEEDDGNDYLGTGGILNIARVFFDSDRCRRRPQRCRYRVQH